MTDTDAEQQAAVSRVAIRVPPFWPADPFLWFAQLEGQFLIHNITRDDTKYGYVIGNLEARYAAEIKDIIVAPPATGKYEKLKTELISRLSSTQEQKTKQLLEREELGDRKPSQFLRRLRDLGGDTITDALLRTLWIGRLPGTLQAILATQTDVTLDAAARLADKVLEVSPQQHIAMASTSNSPSTAPAVPANAIETLMAKMEELQLQIAELQKPATAQPKHVPHGAQRARSKSRQRDRPSSKWPTCWYHWKHGANAHKCITPCDFAAGNSNSSR